MQVLSDWKIEVYRMSLEEKNERIPVARRVSFSGMAGTLRSILVRPVSIGNRLPNRTKESTCAELRVFCLSSTLC
jgi:hypothetical protein